MSPRWRPSTTSCPATTSASTRSSRLRAVRCASRSAGRVLLDTGAPPPARPRLRRGLQTFESGGRRYRAYVTTLRDPGLGGLARLEVVSALAPLEHRQAALEHRLLALGLLALVAAGAGVWLAADLVLRPLRRLRTVASSVAEDEDLDRRVPPGGPTELRSLAASFNAMLARLGRSAADRKRALAATRRFTADAGHELRTPLTSVQATLSTLERHLDLPRRAPRRDARRRAGRAATPRRAPRRPAGAGARRRRAARVHRGRPGRGRRRRRRGRRRTPPRPATSAPSCPTRRSRCRAGSPGCGCWPTTWSRTPSATAARDGRIRVTLDAARPGRGRRRAAHRRRRRARHRRRGPRADLRALRAPGGHQRRGLRPRPRARRAAGPPPRRADRRRRLAARRGALQRALRAGLATARLVTNRARRPLQSDLPWGA